jgi:hypothetical protein
MIYFTLLGFMTLFFSVLALGFRSEQKAIIPKIKDVGEIIAYCLFGGIIFYYFLQVIFWFFGWIIGRF